ncbi:MAG: PorV/PorQ family protein [Candidatus Marinimicrobia bacterium]|nr:PorV/PorQ family protein [Candidatus Neomarinimicrobiota bacterium]
MSRFRSLFGGRTLGMNGSDIAYTAGVDAIYWNPAGLSEFEGRVDGLFSADNYIAGISNNFFGLAFNTGNSGVLAISMKAMSFGEIPLTTVDDMDGESGATYSPTFSVMGLSYSRKLTDRINVGLTGKLIYESVPRASATAFAVDFGLQYKDLVEIKGLSLGLAIRNIGTNMQYGGTALLNNATVEGETYDDYFYHPTSSDQLPASMEMGLSYKAGDMLMLSTTYQNSNTETDYLRVGTELNFADIGFVRAGYAFQLKDAEAELGGSVFGLTLGAGMKFQVSSTNVNVDYVFRPAQHFGNQNLICLGIGF